MVKIEQEVKDLKTAISALESKIDKLQFFLVQIMNKVEGGIETAPAAAPTTSQGPIAVDIGPLEERLELLSKTMLSKSDIEPIAQEISKLRNERMKEAEEALDNVTVLLEKGLALTELTASLKAIEAHLQELVTPPK